MSALTEQPVRVVDARGGTRYPGLDPEDVTIIGALAESTAAETVGVEPGSDSFSFRPSRPAKGISGRIASTRNESNRGPNALIVLNTLLPILTRSGVYCSIVAEGETYGSNSIGYDAFANHTLAALKKLGLYAYADLRVAGFGRESNGEVAMDVEPSYLEGVDWASRGSLREVAGVVATSHVRHDVADRAFAHLHTLAKQTNVRLELEHAQVESPNPGCYITLWARYERGFGGGAAMGARSVRVETLAQTAFEQLIDWMASDGCLDPFLADQILIPCVIAEGGSTFSVSRLTPRFLTAVWVVKQFTPIHITIRGAENQPGMVSIRK
jgi:RNA 3'-terminal phosphate cyclase (ATP)